MALAVIATTGVQPPAGDPPNFDSRLVAVHPGIMQSISTRS